MNDPAKAKSARHSLRLLAGEIGVSLQDISEAAQEIVALRFVLDGRPTKEVLQGIVDDVRREALDGTSPSPAADGEGGPVAPTTPVPPSPHKYRFNATEATEAKYRQRLARAHRTEDNRTGLYLVPRRPTFLRPGAVHPACKAAYHEDADPCSRCKPLLHPHDCRCDVCEEFWEAVDG